MSEINSTKAGATHEMYQSEQIVSTFEHESDFEKNPDHPEDPEWHLDIKIILTFLVRPFVHPEVFRILIDSRS